jgi:hypothetical protein
MCTPSNKDWGWPSHYHPRILPKNEELPGRLRTTPAVQLPRIGFQSNQSYSSETCAVPPLLFQAWLPYKSEAMDLRIL